MNKTLNKLTAITILTIVALSIIPAITLVIPTSAQQYTIATSSTYLNNYSWIEIVITGPADWNNVAFEVLDKATLQPIGLWDSTGNSPLTGNPVAKKYAPGVFVAYLGGKNVATRPQYNKTDAIYNVTDHQTGKTLVIRVPSLGFISAEVKYDYAPISISFDRTSYPPLNVSGIRLTIDDPNWNLDPTSLDTLTPANVSLIVKITNSSGTWSSTNIDDYINLSRITPGSVTETGVNSGRFRFEFPLANVTNLSGIPREQRISLEKGSAIEFTVYLNATFFGHVIRDDIKSSKSFTITSAPPSISLSGSFSDDIKVSVNYPDANLKSWSKDGLNVQICAYPSGGTCSPIHSIDLEETGDNTGVFEKTWNLDWNSTLLGAAKDGKNIIVRANLTYEYESKQVEAFLTLTPVAPKLSLAKTEYFRTETVTLVVEDPDLNDEKDVVEVYTNATSWSVLKDVRLNKSSMTFVNVSLLKLPQEEAVNAVEPYNLSLVERYEQPGVFELKLNLSKLNIAEDSWYRIKVVDYTSGKSASIDFKVVKMAVSVSLDRSTYPLVRNGDLTIYVTVTDPFANTNPYLKDKVSVNYELLNFTMDQKAIGSKDLEETDVNTGIFKGKITLKATDGVINLTEMINGKIVVEYSGKKAEAVFRPSTASLSINATSVKYGDYVLIRVVDRDMNLDSEKAEELTVNGLKLKETGKNTGVFEGVFLVAGDGGDINADPAAKVEIKYNDDTPGFVVPEGEWEVLELSSAFTIASFTGSLSTDKKEYGPAATIKITVRDWDANKNVKLIDYVNVMYVIEGTTGIRTVGLEETDVSSGVFEGEIDLSGHSAATIIGKRISIVYRDPADAAGSVRTLNAVVRVISVDPVFKFDKSSYLIGDVVKVTVEDLDANIDPDAFDTITLRVFSSLDDVGIMILAIETEANSGVFEGMFIVSDTYGSGRVLAAHGTKIFVEYIDMFPADYATTEKAKKFSASAPVGVIIERPIVPKKTSFIDPRTGAVVTPKVGVMVGISVELSNVDVNDQSFTVILVVKDPDGIVVKVDSVSIPLPAGKSGAVTFSFTPKLVGNFGIEAYIVKSLADWSPLGEKLTATMTVPS
ncbi:MAG: hypothetical protein N3G48_04835 [Sulfolobales archaeon]|nr:hypothetical protein [Sulfolobales archaeon]